MTAPKKQANKRADSLLAKQSQTNDELCDVYIEINQTGLHHKHVLRLRQHADESTDDCYSCWPQVPLMFANRGELQTPLEQLAPAISTACCC